MLVRAQFIFPNRNPENLPLELISVGEQVAEGTIFCMRETSLQGCSSPAETKTAGNACFSQLRIPDADAEVRVLEEMRQIPTSAFIINVSHHSTDFRL